MGNSLSGGNIGKNAGKEAAADLSSTLPYAGQFAGAQAVQNARAIVSDLRGAAKPIIDGGPSLSTLKFATFQCRKYPIGSARVHKS